MKQLMFKQNWELKMIEREATIVKQKLKTAKTTEEKVAYKGILDLINVSRLRISDEIQEVHLMYDRMNNSYDSESDGFSLYSLIP